MPQPQDQPDQPQHHALASDVLEREFGPTQVRVLHEDAHSRAVCVAIAAGGQVLELARSTFNNHAIARYPEVHKYIYAGHAMGKTFARFGIEFDRTTRVARRQPLPRPFQDFFASDLPGTVVLVDISVGPDHLHYAQILEVYCPDVQWPETVVEPEPDSETRAAELLQTFGEVL